MNKQFWNYLRHLSKQDSKTLSQKALKTAEEVGELARVVLPFDNAFATNHRFVEKEAILEEAVDTVLTAISVAFDLDFTDEEIEEMMMLKAEKWAKLQAGEKDLLYPIPFEIHITVKTNDVETFKNTCQEIGVKPIILVLHTRSNDVLVDVQTSSKFFGTNAGAYNEAMRINAALKAAGFEIIRTKIETVPCHPASPKTYADKMPPNCYFEAHIPVRFKNTADTFRTLRASVEKDSAHLSQNTFKKHEDGTETLIVTYRTNMMHQEAFEHYTMVVASHVQRLYHEYTEYMVGNPHKEFSVYDTNLSHDSKWLKES
jgi:NTP pyrophosphatase (non-canonical NTP hydrolase)